MEGLGKAEEANHLFLQAWREAPDDFYRFIAAHYVARQAATIDDKLKWNKIALGSALAIDTSDVRACYPSLYLNVGKCYEDLKDFDNARKYYRLALDYTAIYKTRLREYDKIRNTKWNGQA